MAKNIYVGNISYSTTDENLRELFAQHGAVTSAKVVVDRETERSRGFGFVEMLNDQEADAAVAALNGKEYMGRMLKVSEAREQRKRNRF